MKKAIKNFYHRLDEKTQFWLAFLFAMTDKEIKARYKHAVLGFLWIVINPILQMLVMGFVFQFFVPVKVDNYFLFLFSGLLPWNFLSQSLTKATSSFFHERNLIKKSKFPRESIVLSIILSNFLHFSISLLILSILLIGDKVILETYSLSQLLFYILRMFWLIPGIILLLMFVIGISLFTSSLNVRFRDMNFIVQLAVMLWFYATPIVYSLDLLPEIIWPIFYLNPMTAVIEIFHYALMYQKPTIISFISVSTVIVFLVLYLGIKTFKKESKDFDDWL